MSREIRSPRGTELSCKGWQQEAALRMLMNSYDVARDSAIQRGAGPAVCDWDCYDAIVRSLRALENDETLVVQSGKPSGVFRTREDAPRVLIVGAVWVEDESERPRDLDRQSITRWGQMTAEGWTGMGIQAVLADTYETFAAAAKKHFQSDLAGKLVVSGGMGGMGGAQPLAATLNGAAFLGIEADPERIKKCIRAGYCDYCVNDLSEALRILKRAVRQGEAVSVGLVANCADVIPELARRGVVPDLLTDQTSAGDPLNGYIPSGVSLEQAAQLRTEDRKEYLKRSYESIARHVTGMLELQALGSAVFEYGNNIRAMAFERGGVKDAYDFPGFVTSDIGPLLRQGRVPLRWVALSGDAADIRRIDDLALEMFPGNETLTRWIRLARSRVKFRGLPARACWLRHGEAAPLGVRLNEMVARGELKAPVVIARDHRGSCSAHAQEKGGSTVDSPLLDALLGAASGASWIWIQGDAAGELAPRAGYVVVADGSPGMARRIERVLTNDAAGSASRG